MKKVFTIILMALAITALFVSCDDPKHEHSFDANKWEKDGTSHWHVCTTCGEKLDVADHTLETTKAKEPTCTEKGWDEYVTCSICDYSTKKEKPATGHTYNKWESNATNHWHVCATCGEKSDEATHTFEWKQSTDNKKHYTECKVCGYKTAEADHKYAETWSKDETKHWHVCECGAKEDSTAVAHNFGPNTVKDGKAVQCCTVCGYDKTVTDATVEVKDASALAEAVKADGVKIIKLTDVITITTAIDVAKSVVLDLDGKVITVGEGGSISMTGDDVTITIKNFSSEHSELVNISGAQAILGNKTQCIYYTSLKAAIEATDTTGNSAVMVPTEVTLTADNQITVDKALNLSLNAKIEGIENIKLGTNGVINLTTSDNLSGCFGGAVAKIGGSSINSSGAYYSSFFDTALNAASSGDTITLLSDVTLTDDSDPILISKNLTINLADKKLDLKNGALQCSGTIKFMNGNIVNTKGNEDPVLGSYVIGFEGSLTFENVKFNQTGLACTILYTEKGNLSIMNSEFYCVARDSVVATYYGETTVTITGSKVFNNASSGNVKYVYQGKEYSVPFDPKVLSICTGTCKIENSEIKGTGDGAGAVYAEKATVNISVNSIISGEGKEAVAVDANNATVTVSGSTGITGTGDGAVAVKAEKGTIKISENSIIKGTSDALVIQSGTRLRKDYYTYVESPETTVVTVQNSTINSISGYGINISAMYEGSISNLTITNSTVTAKDSTKVYAKAESKGKVGIVGIEEASVSKTSDESSNVYIGSLAE